MEATMHNPSSIDTESVWNNEQGKPCTVSVRILGPLNPETELTQEAILLFIDTREQATALIRAGEKALDLLYTAGV